MTELSAAFREIISRISSFFDIFDLSFFVAGATCFAALVYGTAVGLMDVGKPAANAVIKLNTPSLVIASSAIGSYVLGLICFAAGRNLRWIVRRSITRAATLISNWLPPYSTDKPPKAFRASLSAAMAVPQKSGVISQFEALVKAHGMDKVEPVASYISRHAIEPLYTRFWAELRESAGLVHSYDFIRRYWVKAATFDGLASALILWSIVLYIKPFNTNQTFDAVHLCQPCIAVVLALLCWLEGSRYIRYQVEELTAAIAFLQQTRSAGTPGGPGPGRQPTELF